MRFPFSLVPRKRAHVGPHYADIYSRAVAAAIDLGITFFMLNNLFQLLSEKVYAGVDRPLFQQIKNATSALEIWRLSIASNFAELWLLNMAIQVVIIGVLIITTQIIWGTTPGKWVFGLKIARIKTLEPIEPWRFILRFFAYIPAMAPFMIGIFWSCFNRERRGWHDFIAGTVVLNTHPYEWYRDKTVAGYKWLRKKKYAEKSGAAE